MASSCPVISSNNSSLPEVNKNKDCLFSATNNADIYRSMTYMINLDPLERAKLIEKNIKFAQTMTWENTARKTIEIFNSLQ